MGASITLAGESLIAQKQSAQQPLTVSRFILANVPGLDPTSPVDRAAPKPAAHLVGTYDITQKGFVNPNQIVYSLMLGSDVGDFDWNWIGLETAENVLLAVAYVPLQQKRKNVPPLQIGNNVTRNFLVVFDGAQALTGITIDAKTWQHDFTVRLHGIDERERMSNRDIFGRVCFFGDGFKVEKVGSGYQLKPGVAYVEGVRIELNKAFPITVSALPTPVYLDVSLQRELNDTVASWKVTYGGEDYTDGSGVRHYCVAIAYLKTTDTTDFRPIEPIKGPLIEHLAARVGDYPQLRARATTKDDVELGNLPNAISDDDSTNSSLILATTKAVNAVRVFLQQAIDKLISGVTAVGKAKQLETARRLSISGAGSGSTLFDGSANVDIQLSLADMVAPSTYTKVTVSAKGLVTSGAGLSAGDIPGLDWSKITSGKPTTVESYGINNALITGRPTDQRPILTSPNAGGFDKGGGSIELREAPNSGGSRDYSYAPRMIFHWGGVYAGDFGMDAYGELRWLSGRLWTERNFDPNTKADRTSVAPIATLDQVSAGNDEFSVVTPKTLRWGFSISLAANGYIAFPRWMGGLIVQWGNAYITVNNTQFLFPIGFPNACFVLNMGTGEDTSGQVEVMNVRAGSVTKTGFVGLATSASTYGYIAIGY